MSIILRLYSKLIQKLKSNVFYKNIAIIVSGSILARLVGLLTSPIISRIYTPEDFGILSIFSAVVSVAGSLSTLRYAVTIPLANTEDLADNLLRLSFLITCILSLIWVAMTVILGDYILSKFSIQYLGNFVWLFPITFFGTGIYQSLSFWAARGKKFPLINRTVINQSISSHGIKIGLGIIGFNPWGLIIGYMSSQIAGIGSILRNLIKEKPDFFSMFPWEDIKCAAVRYKRFPIFQSGSQLLLSLSANLPVMMIASYYGTKVAGLYGLANSMISLPMNIFGNAVSQVYYAEIAKYGIADKSKIYTLTVSIVKKMFFLALIPTIVLLSMGPWLFDLFFGNNWYDAGVFARLLSIIILFRFISSPIMHCLNVLEKQGFQFYFNLTRILAIILIFFVANILRWSPETAIFSYSVFISGFYLFVIITVLKMLQSK